MLFRSNYDIIKKNFFAISSKEELEMAKQAIEKVDIRPADPEKQVGLMSGGNQQKISLGKWLVADSKLVIFDEPTRGVDVGAKVEVYNLINKLLEDGVGVIMISSELPEVLGMSDRILVMQEGTLMGELTRDEATQEKIMHLATR